MNPLQGIKEMKNPYATIINASDKSEQALQALKKLSFFNCIFHNRAY